jgi:hypothetical protein
MHVLVGVQETRLQVLFVPLNCPCFIDINIADTGGALVTDIHYGIVLSGVVPQVNSDLVDGSRPVALQTKTPLALKASATSPSSRPALQPLSCSSHGLYRLRLHQHPELSAGCTSCSMIVSEVDGLPLSANFLYSFEIRAWNEAGNSTATFPLPAASPGVQDSCIQSLTHSLTDSPLTH